MCAPINLLVKPGSDFAVWAASDNAVPVAARVSGNELIITTTGPFALTRPIQLVATLPADALEGVAASPAAGAIIVAPGFAPGSGVFNVSSTLGSNSDIGVSSVNATVLNVASGGGGRVTVGGSWESAFLAAGGASTTHLLGGTNSTAVTLANHADAIISPDSADHRATGVALGANSVLVDGGFCDVPAAPAGQACVHVRRVAPPVLRPTFSCGLEVNAPIGCPAAKNRAAAAEALGETAVPAGAPSPAFAEAPGLAPGGRRLSQAVAGAGRGWPWGAPRERAPDRGPAYSAPVVLVFEGAAASLAPCSATEAELMMRV